MLGGAEGFGDRAVIGRDLALGACGAAFLPSDSFAPLFPAAVLPALERVGEPRMAMKESPEPAAHGRKDEGEKEHAHDEERDLRHDRNQNADDPEHEENSRPDEVSRPASGS
jgi:hypothetical protein